MSDKTELDALREALEPKTVKELLEHEHVKALSAKQINDVLSKLHEQNKDLQQRLAAAEQRNAGVEQRASDLIECLWGMELPGAGNPRLRKLRRALEALNPNESGASE